MSDERMERPAFTMRGALTVPTLPLRPKRVTVELPAGLLCMTTSLLASSQPLMSMSPLFHPFETTVK